MHNRLFPDFIIFGIGNYNSLGVLHAMAEADKEVFILSVHHSKDWKRGNIIGYSRFSRFIQSVESAEDGVNWLLNSKSLFPKNTIIYPTGDKEQKAIDMHFHNLAEHYLFPTCGIQGRVSELMDKKLQSQLAEKHGIRVLKSQFTTSPDFSFDKVSYPCMVKPLNSTSGSKIDMHVCENKDHLLKALKESKYTNDFIVQHYIRNEADLLFLGVVLPNGDVELPALVMKPGVSPTGEYTHAIVTTDIDKYLPEKKKVESFIKDLGYVGPFSIEFGLEKGKNYFFEINLRNDGTSHYPLKAGVNIPMLYYNSMRGKHIPLFVATKDYEMIDETGDIRRVLNHDLSFSYWFKSFKGAQAYRFYNSKDKRLIPYICLMFTRRIITKIFRTLK